MKELFRANMYIADSDSVNADYTTDDYLRRFKSSLLMAKSVGMNPNMIFDSQGFEHIIQNDTIEKFFIKKILELQKEGIEYSINLHIFNNFIENDYFDNKTKENPFLSYYHDKIKDDYLFSSYNTQKNELNNNTFHKHQIENKLEMMNSFSKTIFDKTGNNIFKIHNNDFPILKDSIRSRIKYTIANIKNIDIDNNDGQKKYATLLTDFISIINNDQHIINRSHFYSVLSEDKYELSRKFSKSMIQKLKIDIIDISYNSSFIQKGEIFKFKSVSNIDKLYEQIFDSYSNDGKIFKLHELYKVFDDFKSKFELLELAMNPVKIIEYVTSELANSAEDKGVSTVHTLTSYFLRKTRLVGIAESNHLLIGVK